ncbi:MAG: RskA family anti-sigma factor, partial [Actinomycetota bacterium]
MNHEQIRKLAPLLAIDAVSDDERREIHSHMDSCAECFSSMEMALDGAAALAQSADPLTPPASLKQRLMSQIASEAAVVPLAPPQALPPAAHPAAGVQPPAAGVQPPAAGVQPPVPESGKRPRWLA